MELRDLQYFLAVAEHGGVRKAAEALGMSQPGLSKSLRRLESDAAKLVARTPKSVELTAVGSALLCRCAGSTSRSKMSSARPPT
jgi:DNA-binding transcriptional LysR family regulator